MSNFIWLLLTPSVASHASSGWAGSKYCSGVARRRKVCVCGGGGGHKLFLPKSEKQKKKKSHSGVKAQDRVLWIGEGL